MSCFIKKLVGFRYSLSIEEIWDGNGCDDDNHIISFIYDIIGFDPCFSGSPCSDTWGFYFINGNIFCCYNDGFPPAYLEYRENLIQQIYSVLDGIDKDKTFYSLEELGFEPFYDLFGSCCEFSIVKVVGVNVEFIYDTCELISPSLLHLRSLLGC